ncbi:N-acetyllactosaminide 3-alpha-galactosyltransferase [Ancylostoma caninum]|uniref:Hexosyltransferase n=1 Tax=Ancylostoma caninum TaxID=29170 RepID=A0A368FST2_ANCCA|nr:N-acetyllactosaminide 3-alpha-galactosyltransferase [Ancylostoma caninum]
MFTILRCFKKFLAATRFRFILLTKIGFSYDNMVLCFQISQTLLILVFCFVTCHLSVIRYKQANSDFITDLLRQEDMVEYLNEALRPRNLIAAPDAGFCKDIKFLVMVLTKPDDFDTRQLWRKTYGDISLMTKHRYRLMFLIGVRPGSENGTLLEEEIRSHGDLLQASYLDSYRNLVHKTLSGMRYFATACPDVRTLVKIDDDVAWNVTKVSSFIERNVVPGVIYCHSYATKSEWPSYYYPKYCSGVGYIAHKCAVLRMLQAVPQSEFFWVDDIFTTGVLTEKSKVPLYDINNAVEIFKENATKLDSKTMFHLTKQANVGISFVSI